MLPLDVNRGYATAPASICHKWHCSDVPWELREHKRSANKQHWFVWSDTVGFTVSLHSHHESSRDSWYHFCSSPESRSFSLKMKTKIWTLMKCLLTILVFYGSLNFSWQSTLTVAWKTECKQSLAVQPARVQSLETWEESFVGTVPPNEREYTEPAAWRKHKREAN